jgi:hypothetical protein
MIQISLYQSPRSSFLFFASSIIRESFFVIDASSTGTHSIVVSLSLVLILKGIVSVLLRGIQLTLVQRF